MTQPSRPRRVRCLTAVGLLALGLVLAGCADTNSVSGESPALAPGAQPAAAESPSAEPAGGHSTSADTLRGEELDRAFLLGMIPHHRAAVEMAQVELDQGSRPEVQELARMIIAAQEEEIDFMTSIAEEEYGISSIPEHSGPMGVLMGVPVSMEMSTMAEELSDADDVDEMFLTMMIPHHASAAVMAHEQVKNGGNADLRSLARTIIADQAREIGEMQALRKESPSSAK